MKFNPFHWSEINVNETHENQTGRLRALCAIPSALFVEQEGYEALASFGTTFDVEISGPFRFRFECENDHPRIWLFTPDAPSYQSRGEVFTNIDRKPQESGTLLEVKKALRQHQLEMRDTYLRIEAARFRSKPAPEPEPAPDPASDPAPEPAPEPSSTT